VYVLFILFAYGLVPMIESESVLSAIE